MVDISKPCTKNAEVLVITVRLIVFLYATYGVSGVEWAHSRHPLPEYVYDAYMRYWKDVQLIQTVSTNKEKLNNIYNL